MTSYPKQTVVDMCNAGITISLLITIKSIFMLKSMTGFGRTERNVGDKTFQVDIKSLNGKQFELSLKLTVLSV